MISHWSPLPAIPPLMPNSITSMVTHYVSLRIDEKDDKEDFKVWMEEFCEQLRVDSAFLATMPEYVSHRI